jgi:hypothetical protein
VSDATPDPIALTFMAAMEVKWRSMGNQSSEGLRKVWYRMAQTYMDAIVENLSPNRLVIGRPSWLVLAPEMGTGKTIGACLFLGLMAGPRTDFGGLLACRTINQCEEAVRRINEHAGFEAAITRHSENEVTLDEAAKHPVLVITHAALVKSDDDVRGSLLESYSKWAGGRRSLTIIDEALANAVEFNEITERSLLKLMGAIPEAISDRHKTAWEVLDSLRGLVATLRKRDKEAWGLWDVLPRGIPFLENLPATFENLLADLKAAKRKDRRPDWNDAEQRKAEMSEVEGALRSVVGLFRNWAIFAPGGSDPGIISARTLLPDLWRPVVLDATARQDVLLDAVGAHIVPLPQVRNYRNLTIKVLKSRGIGKQTMMHRAASRFQRLGEFVRASSEPGDHWLVVTHKGTEAVARLNLPLENCVLGHWGALDGLNTFRECNKAVLFGLSYRDPTWSTTMYFALRGKQPDAWFKSAEAKEVKHSLETKVMAAQVLQALGRPRSRHMSDEDGNCPPTTVYLTLPEGRLGRTIEQHIRDRLPGVVIEPWEYELDGSVTAPDAAGRRSVSAAVITHMRNQPPGRWTVGEIAADLEFTDCQRRAFKEGLTKKRKVYQELASIGVAYVVEGHGRMAKSYLVKHQ